jgi:hypothetical protein
MFISGWGRLQKSDACLSVHLRQSFGMAKRLGIAINSTCENSAKRREARTVHADSQCSEAAKYG